MKKWGIIAVILLAVLAIYLLFFQKDSSTPQSNPNEIIETSQLDTTRNVNESNISFSTSEQEDKQQLGNYKFELYRFGEKVKYDELDKIEKVVVGFVSEFYNVNKDETEAGLNQRIKPYIHPKAEDLSWFLNLDMFPSIGERKLKAVYLPPEYLTEPAMYTVPTKLIYSSENGEIDELIYFAVTLEMGKEPYFIIGHADGREWFLNELEVKYGEPKK